MRARRTVVNVAIIGLALFGCAASEGTRTPPTSTQPTGTAASRTGPPGTARTGTQPTAAGATRTEPAGNAGSAVRPSPAPTASSTASPTPQPPEQARTGPADPRWRFFVDDPTRYRSAWFDGAQRIMIGYGCTRAPFYRADRRCRDGQGFHHGIDVALPCRTTMRAGVAGRVVDPDRPGRPGPAYGATAFRLRVEVRGRPYDVLIGHATRVLVRPGDRVRAGQRIATAGARGAPDGCHLHFEQRRVDGGVADAVDPADVLGLRPA